MKSYLVCADHKIMILILPKFNYLAKFEYQENFGSTRTFQNV